MRTAAVVLFLLLQDPAGWWNKEWNYRRRITVRNNAEGDLKAGFPKDVEIDPGFFKTKPDLSDLVIVHDGKEIPYILRPGRKPGTSTMWFRTAADVKLNGSDDRYYLYYGSAGRRSAQGEVFDLLEDFAAGRVDPKRFDIEKDIEWTVKQEALFITNASSERTEHSPSRIVLKAAPPAGGFALSFDLEIDPDATAGFAFGVEINLKEPSADDPKIDKRVEELVDKLGAFDWEERETATVELIKIGRPALKRLGEALKSSDAEVKWRAEHIIKEIRENAPSPTIYAGLRFGDRDVSPVAQAWTIGKSRGKQKFTPHETPLKLTLTVLREEDGEVTILWGNERTTTGSLPGEVRDVSLVIHKGTGGRLGRIVVDNVLLRRFVGEDARPTHLLDVEETQK